MKTRINNVPNFYTETALYSSEAAISYSIVIDAGSSGTRLRIYQGNKALEQVDEVFSNEISPGLQDVAQDDLIAYLASLFNDEFKQFVLKNSIPTNIPVRFYATGGMRDVNPTVADETYQTITDYLTISPYSYTDVIAKTISGQQEGLYDFVSYNSLTHGLQEKKSVLSAVFDFGGASIEFAYQVDPNTTLDQNVYQLQYNGASYPIYSATWLGAGNDQSRQQVERRQGCFPIGYPIIDDNPIPGSVKECDTFMKLIFLKYAHPVDINLSPASDQSLVFLSGAYYNMLALNAINGTQLNLAQYRINTANFCETPWSEITSSDQYGSDSYANTYCSGANVLNGFIAQANIADSFSETQALKKINGTSVGWAQGLAWLLLTSANFTQIAPGIASSGVNNALRGSSITGSEDAYANDYTNCNDTPAINITNVNLALMVTTIIGAAVVGAIVGYCLGSKKQTTAEYNDWNAIKQPNNNRNKNIFSTCRAMLFGEKESQNTYLKLPLMNNYN